MDDEQLPNKQGKCVDNEAFEKELNDLVDRINAPTDDVRLSAVDKLQISFGLQFLRLEIVRNNAFTPDKTGA